MTKIFKNKKIQFKFQKCFFHFNDFFHGPRLPNLLKDCKNYLFTLIKNSYILHTTLWYSPL
jgi:transposase-like protein